MYSFSFLAQKNADLDRPGTQFLGMSPSAVESESRIQNVVNQEDIPAHKVSAAVVKTPDFSSRAGALITGDIPKLDLGIWIQMTKEIDNEKDTSFEKCDDCERAVLVGLADGRG
jgi:hypothetical protein